MILQPFRKPIVVDRMNSWNDASPDERDLRDCLWVMTRPNASAGGLANAAEIIMNERGWSRSDL